MLPEQRGQTAPAPCRYQDRVKDQRSGTLAIAAPANLVRRGPGVPAVHGLSPSTNSSHLNTTGYQFREFSLTEGAAPEAPGYSRAGRRAAAISISSWGYVVMVATSVGRAGAAVGVQDGSRA
jgi:hypothetical protein